MKIRMPSCIRSLCIIVFVFTWISSAKAQEEVAIAIEAMKTLPKLWNAGRWVIDDITHNWWVCKYQDGTRVYNSFKSKRTGEDVYKFFTGANGVVGDCDSWYFDSNCNRITVCYRSMAERMAMKNRHGLIVDVYREMPPPCNNGQRSQPEREPGRRW